MGETGILTGMQAQDAGWSRVLCERDVDSLIKENAELKKEQKVLRNQMHVMAAFMHQPAGVYVHGKACMLQARLRGYALRTRYTKSRAAAVKIQAARRSHAQSTKWRAMLGTFPERTKAALLTRAMEEKERADALEDIVRKTICSELVERMRTAVSEKLRLDAESRWKADSAQAAFLTWYA